MRRIHLLAALVVLATTAAPAFSQEAIDLFNGKNLDGWKFKGNDPAKGKLKVGKTSLDKADPTKFAIDESATGELINYARGVDFYTDAKFGDVKLEIEFTVPKGSNSGIYVMGEYEVQILDSYGRKQIGQGDLGALYGAAVPKENAALAPGEWQKFVIEFQAPRFDKDGKKIANAKFLKVTLNGKVIHENVEMKGPTPGGLTGKEAPTGPLMIQGDHGPVAFRLIRATPLK
jgi:hypothetical protein